MKIWKWLLFLMPFHLCAQVNAIQDITIADGLSQGMVFSMLQDHNGFVWMATKDGLNRFDGYNYKTYFYNPKQRYGISESQVTALHEDKLGRLWVGTMGKGLNLFDHRTQRFYHTNIETPGSDNAQKNTNQPISSIAEDALGRIWIGTHDGKILVLKTKASWPGNFPTAEAFTADLETVQFPCPPNEKGNGGVTFYVTAKNGLLAIIGTGLYKIDSEKLLAQPILAANLQRQKTLGVFEAPDASLIITQTNCVVQWKDTGIVKTLLNCNPTHLPTQLLADPLGNIWGLMDNQLYRQHYSEINDHFFEREPVSGMKKSGNLTCTLLDNQQQLWLGTNGFGIKKWAARPLAFKHVLAGNSIWHVYKDRLGRTFLWDFVFPYLLDTLTGQASPRPLLPQYSGPGRGKGKMVQDKNGDFWWVVKKEAATNRMILLHLNENLDLIKEYDLQQDANFQYSAIIQDHNGFIWIANRHSGIIRFNPHTGLHEVYDYSQQIPPNEITNSVINMYEDSGGALWICTNKGLLKAVWKNNAIDFTLYKNDPNNAQSLPTGVVTGVLDDPYEPNKWLWIATHGGGLARMEKTSGAMRLFTNYDGLLNSNVVGILADAQHNIWISTYRGISVLNPKTFVFRHFSERDGLQSDEFNTGVFCKSASGELLFGGINGLNIFNPATLSASNTAPSAPKVIGLKLNNEPVQPDDDKHILNQAIEYLPALSLSHEQNQLTFEFSTLDLQNANKSRYRYQMVGIDKDWVQSGTNRFANYAQLPAGKYTLRVAASTDGLLWSTPTQLYVTIHPAWYRSWWAYCLYAIIAIALARWAYLSQIRRIKLQNQLAFESKEAVRLAEIDQLKTHFFNNISHEFRTPLTLLISPVDDLKSKYPHEPLLDMMRRNGQRLLSLFNQLLDLGKLDAQQMKVNLMQGDLVEFIRAIASSFDTVAVRNGLLFEKLIKPLQLPAHFDADKIEKIVTNLLSNAFKFTSSGQNILLKVDFDNDNNQLELLVKDTGAGIAKEKLDKIFDRFYQADTSTKRSYEGTGIGLSLVKELVTLLKGTIRVESELGRGTAFCVTLPINFADTTAIGKTQLPVLEANPNHAALPLELTTHGNDKTKALANKPASENVLLIAEDNDDLRAYIKSVFEDSYQVIEAKDGQAAFEKALETIPDIIISDLMMPRLDGFEFCKLIKTTEKTSHIPVVMLTAKGSLESRIEGFEQGADDYLTKPFNTTEIQARVASLIRNREQLRQLFSQKTITAAAKKAKLPSMDEVFIDKANAVIDQFIGESGFDAVRFADSLNMTPLQLRRKLKAITNYATVEYVRKYRLQKASNLLAQKTGTVSEVAYYVGFESLSYFSKAFQEEFGVVPSEYVGETVK